MFQPSNTNTKTKRSHLHPGADEPLTKKDFITLWPEVIEHNYCCNLEIITTIFVFQPSNTNTKTKRPHLQPGADGPLNEKEFIALLPDKFYFFSKT